MIKGRSKKKSPEEKREVVSLQLGGKRIDPELMMLLDPAYRLITKQ